MRPKFKTRKTIITQAKKLGLKGISRLSIFHPPTKALKEAFTTWKMTPILAMDVQTFLDVSQMSLEELITIWTLKGAKINVVLHCTFVNINPSGNADDENKGYFHSRFSPRPRS